MSRAIRIHSHGGPEVMSFEDFTPGAPAAGEVQVRHTAIGVNFIDVYDRTGLYPQSLPSGLGREAAGVIAALGRGVRGWRVGERVAYVWSSPGAYSELRNVPAERLVRVPRGVSDEQAAALMLKGLTAHYLLRRTCRVARGDPILVHAAAGGVGLILCQWGRALGAKVIGVVGNEEKARLARANGARQVLIAGRDDIVARVKALTGGVGVRVAYDGVGKDTFTQSLDCLRPLGMMVTFGNASGPVPPVSPLELSRRGSLFLTRPVLFNYISTREQLAAAARELFAVVRARKVKVRIGLKLPLEQAAEAHRALESRHTTGATVLIPS
ncbi:MAG: quinone oxidoreductase [Proteobacteria bacterium]|nr:quinone oxidoreductase [Pseudomonadota bacterium]